MKKFLLSKNLYTEISAVFILAAFVFGASRAFTPGQTLSGVLFLMLAALLGFSYFQSQEPPAWPRAAGIFAVVAGVFIVFLNLPPETEAAAGVQNVVWDALAALAGGIGLDRIFKARKNWAPLGWLLGASGVAYWAGNLAAWPWAVRWIWLGTVGLGTLLAYFLSAPGDTDAAPANGKWWQSERLQNILLSVFWLAFAATVWVKNAWVSDDAYITFRTVDNFLHGYGLRWNVVERVQAYTHPLWMGLLAGGAALTHEVYYTSICLGIGFTLTALLWFWFKTGIPRENWFIPAVGLTFSKALVEFTTSGLENSLSYALVVWFYILALQAEKTTKRFFLLTLLLALGMLTRTDLALLLGIPWIWFFWEQGKDRGFKSAAGWSLLGFSPLFAWEIFSWIYYGFGVPNTAFAKLGSGLSWEYFLRQGIAYFLNSLATDPVTLWVIGLGLVFGFLSPDRRKQLLALGVLAYLAYVLKIGGDFMSGRFYSVPFLGALILLTLSLNLRLSSNLLLAGFILMFCLVTPRHPWREVQYQDSTINKSGIMDEQGYYYQLTGLINASPQTHFDNAPSHVFAKAIQSAEEYHARGKSVIVVPCIGLFGYYAGPEVYLVDIYALANPFLAHMPSLSGQRIGHFERKLPGGYLETLRTGQMKIINPETAKLYTRITRITQAPIWDRERWRDIISAASGRDPIHINLRYYQANYHRERKLAEIAYADHDVYDRAMQAGRSAFIGGQYEKAESSWQEAKRFDPKRGYAEGSLAIFYAWEGYYSPAFENYRLAQERIPDFWREAFTGFEEEMQDEAVQ